MTDPTSGLLCPFNAGTTTITIRAGGLSYSTKVTVQAGSVLRPCGTPPGPEPLHHRTGGRGRPAAAATGPAGPR